MKAMVRIKDQGRNADQGTRGRDRQRTYRLIVMGVLALFI